MNRLIYLLLTVALSAAVFPICSQAVAQQKKDDQKKVVNPLEKIVNQIFGKKRKAEQDKVFPDENPAPYKKDAVDQRAPLVREYATLLHSARSRIELKQYPEALEILQNILDHANESIIQENDGHLRSIRWVTQEELANLPLQALQYYEKTYGPLAKKMLEEAYRQSDFPGIRNVARRYFHTQAGYEAANRIASYHVDQGEFAIAAQWYGRLDSTAARFVTDPLWRVKVAEVYRQSALDENRLDPLTAEQQTELQRRLPSRPLEEIRKHWEQLSLAFNPPLNDWLFPGGNARRSGLAQGTVPLLLSYWQQKMTEHPGVLRQINQLHEDLEINRIPSIPMTQPIAFGKYVVVRTLDGLKTIDSQTGNVLWESREKISPTMLLTGSTGTNQNLAKIGINFQIRGRIMGNGMFVNSSYGQQSEQHPLANLLFRNAVHSTLSSDGKNVFVIERNAVLSKTVPGMQFNNYTLANNDPYRRDWSSNRLTAYNLKTGKMAWHVGGSAMNERIDPPLAGTYFLGPPLTDEGELFIVGERDNALRVYCLQAEDGKVLWSQLLAYTDAPIDRDLARRWGAAQLAISEGVLVCPTHIGFLVGIDRQSQEILWMSRYTEKQKTPKAQPFRQRGGGFVMTSPGSLKERWFATPVMISGQTVIHAPLEEPVLTGYRLTDGQQRWKISGLEQGLYPLGCYNSQLIVVSEEALTGYDVNSGEEKWRVPFSEFRIANDTNRPVPCGRGLIVGNQVMLPIAQQEIWYFDLDNKKFSSRAKVADANLKLGNLIMAQGNLISAGLDTIAMFQPKRIVEQEINARLKEDLQDSWALLKKAQILALEQQYQAGLNQLTRIRTDSLPASQQTQYRHQMLECLMGTVKGNPLEFDRQFEQIPNYIESDTDRQIYLRLKADRMLKQKNHASAFEAFAKLAEYQSSTLIRDMHDMRLSSRQDVWLYAQLKKLWNNSSGEVSSKITSRVQKSVKEALTTDDLPKMMHIVRVYGFHPEIEKVYVRIVDLATEQKDFSTAEFALKTMAQFNDESIATTANARQAELLHQFGLHDDAVHFLEILENKNPDLVLLDGLTVGEWLQEKKQENWPRPALAGSREESWKNEEFEIVRISTSSWSQQTGTVNLSKSDLPFYKKHRFEFNTKSHRLEIIRLHDDRLIWSIPLQQNNSASSNNVLPIRIDGHLLTIYHRGIIQCYSIPDQRLVWSRPITRHVSNLQITHAVQQRLTSLQKTQHAASRFRINRQNTKFGPLVFSSPETLCYLGRYELVAVDPLDGEIRWTRRGIPKGTAIYGDKDYLFILPPNLNETIIVSTSDGKLIESDELSSLVNHGIAMSGHHVITVENKNNSILGLNHSSIKISSVDLITRDPIWEHHAESDDYIGLLDRDSLIIVKKQGTVQVVNLSDGTIEVEGEIQEERLKGVREIYALGDNDQLYLILNNSSRHTTYFNGIMNQPLNGLLVSLNRDTGKQMWTSPIKGLNLVLQDVDQIPVLIAAGMKHERIHSLYLNMFRVLILDKQTGKPLFKKSLTTPRPIQRINWSIPKKQIRMHSYNSTYSLQPKRKVAQNISEK